MTTWGHFQVGKRCPHCYGNVIKTTEEIKVALIKEGYKLLSEYKNAHTKIKIQCPKEHIFQTMTWNSFQQGIRCPYCKNKTEQKFREVIEEIAQVKFSSQRPQWLINPQTNYPLELDGYNEELGVAFEYQGRQHFEVISYFKDTKEKLAKRQTHDKLKKKLCKKNNVVLLCPTYELKEEEFSDFIMNVLKDGSVTM